MRSNLKHRILATIVDYVIYGIFFFVYINYYGHDNDEGGKTVEGLMAIPIFLVWFLYFVVTESMFGATFGHYCADLKVLTVDQQKISFTQALRRRSLDPIDIFLCGIPAFIAIKNSEKHQRLGDMWANTIVVNTK